jgi:hypothetical protein
VVEPSGAGGAGNYLPKPGTRDRADSGAAPDPRVTAYLEQRPERSGLQRYTLSDPKQHLYSERRFLSPPVQGQFSLRQNGNHVHIVQRRPALSTWPHSASGSQWVASRNPIVRRY